MESVESSDEKFFSQSYLEGKDAKKSLLDILSEEFCYLYLYVTLTAHGLFQPYFNKRRFQQNDCYISVVGAGGKKQRCIDVYLACKVELCSDCVGPEQVA